MSEVSVTKMHQRTCFVLILAVLGTAQGAFLPNASASATANAGKPAVPAASSTATIRDSVDAMKRNVHEATVDDGQSLELNCPRPNDKKGNMQIIIQNATYGASQSKGTGANKCLDVDAKAEFSKSCDQHPTCSVKAADSAQASGCKQRPLRISYVCESMTRGSLTDYTHWNVMRVHTRADGSYTP